MARPIRIEYAGAWYHVTSRGNERKNIFQDDQDRGKFLEILADSLDRYHAELHGYVLMTNHYHLLLKTLEANLKHLMQRFNTTYTVYYNRRHHRQGHLYQGRYKAILVQADTYLLELSRYLHLNPVSIPKHASLSPKEKLAELREYHWSSYPGYALNKRQDFVTYAEILGMMGLEGGHAGCKQYQRFVEDAIRHDEKIPIWDDLRGQTVLGDDTFMKWIYDRFVGKSVTDEKEQAGIKAFPVGPERISEVAEAVARIFGIKEAALYQRRSPYRDARAVFLELCCYLSRRTRLAELGKKLGGISSAALCQNRKRLSAKLTEDTTLRKKVEMIRANWEQL
jgi:putative transposase